MVNCPTRRINRKLESRLREKYMRGLEPTDDNEQQADLCAQFEMRRRRITAKDRKLVREARRLKSDWKSLEEKLREHSDSTHTRMGDRSMKEKIVYLLTGETGEYSDRQEWPVAAFTEANKAILHKELCEREIEGINPRNCHLSTVKSRFDPNIQMDYTGTSYFISEVPLNPRAKSNA